ncbi:DinB family protein [Streptomyces sp. ITFR-16]|uniref:DinB family protein n=1 Tax=Streptomyces sp. ITFR-16 TaxID=3075198 RepID=UPI00288C5F07|nr:DinB family protein [Streptomyces sp. ITFR-16]WNI22253.1 DinB family protein [Streptomyces sp. ITFR-16]
MSVTGTDTRDTGTTAATATTASGADERADLLEALAKQRHFLRFTARGLTDEQAGQRTTASALCVGGLIKHVTEVERSWAGFLVEGAASMPDFTQMTEADFAKRADDFAMGPGDTLAGVLDAYAEAARRTDEVIASLPDLGVTHLLPKAPWYEGRARWSARRAVLHMLTETAQHAGHADIIRESLDGAQSMA